MKEIHEGESLRNFALDRTTISQLIRKADITRSQFKWLADKKKLEAKEKRTAMSWIHAVWPGTKAEEVFTFQKGNTNIEGDNNANNNISNSIFSTGSSGELIMENEILKTQLKAQEREIELLKEMLNLLKSKK